MMGRPGDCCTHKCNQGRNCAARERRELPAWAWFIAVIIAGVLLGWFALHLMGVTAANAADPLAGAPW